MALPAARALESTAPCGLEGLSAGALHPLVVSRWKCRGCWEMVGLFWSRRTEMRLSSSAGEEAAVLGALQARAEGKGRCWKVLYWAFPEASAETGNIFYNLL